MPDEVESIEYLLSRKRLSRPHVENYSVFHVISFQRRLNYIKNEFFQRGVATPLGETTDWWDRIDDLLNLS